MKDTMKDTIGDRMKRNYETRHRRYLARRELIERYGQLFAYLHHLSTTLEQLAGQ